jgi:hypothetical protein
MAHMVAVALAVRPMRLALAVATQVVVLAVLAAVAVAALQVAVVHLSLLTRELLQILELTMAVKVLSQLQDYRIAHEPTWKSLLSY